MTRGWVATLLAGGVLALGACNGLVLVPGGGGGTETPTPTGSGSPTPSPTPTNLPPQDQYRVMTWNIQTMGAPGTYQYEAVKEVFQRLSPDVIAMNEINSNQDRDYAKAMADDLGYDYWAIPGSGVGSLRNGFISRLPILEFHFHTGATLSGDPYADDLARAIVEVVVMQPSHDPLRLVSMHWKSGTGNADEFRRAIESYRITQVLDDANTNSDYWMVMGDMNDEILNMPESPSYFTSEPSGLPGSFQLGDDIAGWLSSGLYNDPFDPIDNNSSGLAARVLPAKQVDGTWGTRPASGRRLDYIMVSERVWDASSIDYEVFNSENDGSSGIPKEGSPLDWWISSDASDHLPVVVDYELQ